MDQESDFIGDFRARRIRTQITTWENLSAIWDSFPGINSPGQALVYHARGFSGSRTRLQWSMHQASVEHAPGFSGGVGLWVGGGVLEPPTFSENSGRISSSPQNPGGHLPEIQGIQGILHHQTASFAGAPITIDKRCHVTQPRARINVSCSRAGHKGATGGSGDHKKGAAKELRRTAKSGSRARVPDRAEQGRCQPPDELAP